MIFRYFITCVLLNTGLVIPAAEEFHGPEAYPVDRYIPLWDKNPFTLKTAAAALQRESFAKDLALAGITRIGADTTVLLVNTKTREYLRLKNEDIHASGMRVKTVSMKETRSDSSVEVAMGSEATVLKYDTGFLAQMAAQVPSPANGGGINGGLPPPQIPLPVLPGSPQSPGGGAPQPGMAGGINQDGRPGLPPVPLSVNGSPMANAPQLIPSVPTRRVRTAPVGHPNPSVPNP
ncbi:hypothetical protein BH11VER1_BH11VER1_23130 [soil metagenome]